MNGKTSRTYERRISYSSALGRVVMYSKSRVSAVASLAILLMLTGSNVAMAKPHNTLTLGLAGGFVDIGSQKYHSKGTAAGSISFFWTSISSSGWFFYSIERSVH